MRLLIVEDDVSTRELLDMLFSSMDFKSTGSLKEALSYLKDKKPDYIILDILLTEGLGIDIIDEAYKLYKDSPPKIIVMSAYAKAENLLQNYKIEKFIKKPFELNELENIIFSS